MPRKVLGGLRLAGCEERRPHPVNTERRRSFVWLSLDFSSQTLQTGSDV